MKRLFILARSRRSVTALESEFDDFERSIGQSLDSAVMCGDLLFWPVAAAPASSRGSRYHPSEFWEQHRAALESGLLSEIVVGEIGNRLFAACECDHIDRFQDREFLYGTEAEEAPAPSDGEQAWYDDDDPYGSREFWTVGALNWSDEGPAEETPSFGRKLLIVIGREPGRRFLESPPGQKLRAWLGESASVVFNSRHEDVVVIAFVRSAWPDDLFDQIKRFMPPRLVEDFLIVDIGANYYTGHAPISLFAEWDETRSTKSAVQTSDLFKPARPVRQIPVERVNRRKPRARVA